MGKKTKHLRSLFFHFRRLSSFARRLPDFLIIGVQKGGTTTFFNYLLLHSQINSGFKKEIHFFDQGFDKGINFYRSFFPLISRGLLTEATPNYFFIENVASRIANVQPQIKAIVLLRNPIDRAWSHFQMMKRRGLEENEFEEAISIENDRLNVSNKKDRSYNLTKYSYLSRGFYSRQLQNWYRFFEKDQLLIIISEEFFNDPVNTIKLAHEFVGLQHEIPERSPKINLGRYDEISTEMEAKLKSFYKPDILKLKKMINRESLWGM